VTEAPKTAMVLAAGLGKRMRPITDTLPKPLVRVAGRALLDWGLDSLARAGVEKAVVNVHYLPDQIVAHVAGRDRPRIVISDERDALLDSAGGIVRALPQLGAAPFYVVNADTFWIDSGRPSLDGSPLPGRRAHGYFSHACGWRIGTGHSGGMVFVLEADGAPAQGGRRPGRADLAGRELTRESSPAFARRMRATYISTGLAAGRLHGVKMRGRWITVGTPDALPQAEAAVAGALAREP